MAGSCPAPASSGPVYPGIALPLAHFLAAGTLPPAQASALGQQRQKLGKNCRRTSPQHALKHTPTSIVEVRLRSLQRLAPCRDQIGFPPPALPIAPSL